MGKVTVHIEYCNAWGYAGKCERLKRAILAAVPTAEVIGAVGRKNSFEITLNGTLIHSKLKTDKMPDEKEIIALVKKAAEAN